MHRDPFSDISIITVTYHSAAVIGGWLESVANHAPGAEVVVVDNASCDGTRAVVEAHPSSPRMVPLTSNAGFGRGCNAGAKHATRPVLWFLNPDARIETVDVDALRRALERRDDCLLESAHMDSAGLAHDIYAHRGHAGEWAAHVLGPFWPRGFGRAPWAVSSGDDWASGASLLISGTRFKELDGFDPSFFLLYEDRDLSVRAARAGMSVSGLDAIVTSHAPGGSSSVSDLDVRRRLWALLSWIEYAAATEGAESARRYAVSIMRWLRIFAGGDSDVTVAPRSRVAVKRAQAAEVLSALLEHRWAVDESFYTRARHVIDSL